MKYALLRILPLLALLPASSDYSQQSENTVTLTSSSPTLQLPGSLTLTTTVAPPAATAGAPTGNIQFFNNATNSLGTAALKVIPSTQNFSAPGILGTLGNSPYGMFTLPGVANYSALGVLDYGTPDPTTGIVNPQLTVYTGQGAGLFQTASAPYVITTPNITSNYVIDAYSVGDFNHDGILDVLIHGYSLQGGAYGYAYYVLPGKAGATFDTSSAVISGDASPITCYCDVASTEAIAVDDFNGDGYADVAYAAILGPNSGQAGVALNAGAIAPGTFAPYVSAPPIVPTVQGETFQSSAIASGHFTSSGYPDIVIAGSSSVGTTGYVALYINHGPANGTITFATPVLFNVGFQPGAIATGDFRANGMTDVVVTNIVTTTQTGSVQVLFGDGKGSLTTSSTVPIPVELASVSVSDFNNDGFPDILAVGTDGSLNLLLNDGTGHFAASTTVAGAYAPSLSAIGDFNGDGLNDIAELTFSAVSIGAIPGHPGISNNAIHAVNGVGGKITAMTANVQPKPLAVSLSSATAFLNSASSQTTFVTTAKTLPAGNDTLTAHYVGDANFLAGTSAGVPVTVTQTPSTLTWAQPAAIEYGTPLSATQLNATASVVGAITYAPAAGTVLPPGSTTVTATFVPTDTFDYTGATTNHAITVTAPSMTGITPSGGKLGDANTTITVNGQGLVQGAVVEWNGTALTTTWVNLNKLTAVIPSTLLASAGTATITVVDPNKVAVAGSQTFTIVAAPAVATVNAPGTVEAGQPASVTLTINPYPAPVTATLTLTFTPDPPNTVGDPAVLFPNNTTTEVIQIPANSTAAIPAIDFATGSTAGTITLTLTLTASGVNVTPTTLAPIVVVVPAAAPVINSVTLTRSADTITIAILGLSSPRDMTQATFHFTAASGASLKTTDLTVDLTAAFTTWYSSAASDAFGTTFLYTQPFTLSSDATNVGTVSVTLSNSQGASQPGTAQ